MSDEPKNDEQMNAERKGQDQADAELTIPGSPDATPDSAPETAPDFRPDDESGKEMISEAEARQREIEKRIEAENQKLLAELQTGEARVMKRDGAAKITARKMLDEISGKPVIIRFCEYGTNPFKPVYLLMDERNIEVMPLGTGAVICVNGVPCFVPGAKVIEDGENPGYFKLV